MFINRPAVADPGFPRVGAPTHDFAKFSQKLYEVERIWTPPPPHLDPPRVG